MPDKTLIFFTSDFPFGTGETFIENELPYLEKAFDQIIIVSNNTQDKQIRKLNKKISVLRMPYDLNQNQRLLSVLSVFSNSFWKEMRVIRQTYHKKLSSLVLKTMLISLYKAKILCAKIQTLIKPGKNVYYYSYWNNDMALALAIFKQKFPKTHCFSRMHGWDVYFEVNESKYLPYRKLIFKNLDKVFAISDKGKTYYQQWFPELQNKISVSRLGVPKRSINPGNKSNRLNILSVSNIIPVKNLESLIDALTHLNFDFFWTHFGDGTLKERLQKKAEAMIPGKFAFKGRVPNNEVLKYMQTQPVDLFVNVSHSEGIPVSIMEAFSCGIPAIATDVGGNAEIVKHQVNGLLVENSNDHNEIARRIKSFTELDTKTKEKMRKEAYATWNKTYNAEINYQNFTKNIIGP